MMTGCEISEALFTAFASGDSAAARALCDPQMRASQNHAEPMTLEQLLEFSSNVNSIVKDFHYAQALRWELPNGFVEEHSVRGTLPDGNALSLAACVFGEVRDGKIVELREYVDSAAAIPLAKALAGR